MTLFVDENLPRSINTFFRERGHVVYGVGEGFPSGSPDQVVLALVDQQGAVVVSNDNDWKTLVSRIPTGQASRFKRAGRLLLNCNDHTVALQRVIALIDVIEREYEEASKTADGRLIMRITGGNYRVER